MVGERLGRWSGIWATAAEIVGMLHVTDQDESPVGEICEGMFLRDQSYPAVVWEVFLIDGPGERVFLIET